MDSFVVVLATTIWKCRFSAILGFPRSFNTSLHATSCRCESSILHVTGMYVRVCMCECFGASDIVCILMQMKVCWPTLSYLSFGDQPFFFPFSHISCCHCIDRAFMFPTDASCFSVFIIIIILCYARTVHVIFFSSISSGMCTIFSHVCAWWNT